MKTLNRPLFDSSLVLALALGLLLLPACDSGGSNGGDDGTSPSGGGTFGPSNPSGANAFELNFSSASSLTEKTALAKATTTYRGYSFQFQGQGNGQDFFAIFFSSKSSFSSGATSGPELFGVLAMQRSSKPSTGTYNISSAGGGPDEFYGLIGRNFDEKEDTGTRTLQLFQNGSITLTKKNGNLAVSAFNNVEALELVFDVANDELESEFDPQNPPTVSVNLNGEIVPKTTSAFARPSFGFSVSTGGAGGGGGDGTRSDPVRVTNALNGDVSLTVEGHNQTVGVDVSEIESQDGVFSDIDQDSFNLNSSGGAAVTQDIDDPEDLGDQNDPSGFRTYKVAVGGRIGSGDSPSGLTVTLNVDGSPIATVEKPLSDDAGFRSGEWVIEVSSP